MPAELVLFRITAKDEVTPVFDLIEKRTNKLIRSFKALPIAIKNYDRAIQTAGRDTKKFSADTMRAIAAIQQLKLSMATLTRPIAAAFGFIGRQMRILVNRLTFVGFLVGVLMVREVIRFEEAWAKVVSLIEKSPLESLGVTARQARIEILEMAGAAGTAVDVMTGLFEALSAQIPQAQALQFMGEATKLAVTGFIDTAQAVDVLTTSIQAMGFEVAQTHNISAVLFKTVDIGKVKFGELATNMGRVLPTAGILTREMEELAKKTKDTALAGVAAERMFIDVAAALSTLTLRGLRPSVAITSLNRFLIDLVKNRSEIESAFQSLNAEFDEFKGRATSVTEVLASEGLTGIIDRFAKIAGEGGAQAVRALTRDMRGLRAVLNLVNSVMEENALAAGDVKDAHLSFNEILIKMQVEWQLASEGASKFDRALKAVQETMHATFREFQASVTMMGVLFGDAFFGVSKSAIEGISRLFEDLSLTAEFNKLGEEFGQVFATFVEAFGTVIETLVSSGALHGIVELFQLIADAALVAAKNITQIVAIGTFFFKVWAISKLAVLTGMFINMGFALVHLVKSFKTAETIAALFDKTLLKLVPSMTATFSTTAFGSGIIKVLSVTLAEATVAATLFWGAITFGVGILIGVLLGDVLGLNDAIQDWAGRTKILDEVMGEADLRMKKFNDTLRERMKLEAEAAGVTEADADTMKKLIGALTEAQTAELGRKVLVDLGISGFLAGQGIVIPDSAFQDIDSLTARINQLSGTFPEMQRLMEQATGKSIPELAARMRVAEQNVADFNEEWTILPRNFIGSAAAIVHLKDQLKGLTDSQREMVKILVKGGDQLTEAILKVQAYGDVSAAMVARNEAVARGLEEISSELQTFEAFLISSGVNLDKVAENAVKFAEGTGLTFNKIVENMMTFDTGIRQLFVDLEARIGDQAAWDAIALVAGDSLNDAISKALLTMSDKVFSDVLKGGKGISEEAVAFRRLFESFENIQTGNAEAALEKMRSRLAAMNVPAEKAAEILEGYKKTLEETDKTMRGSYLKSLKGTADQYAFTAKKMGILGEHTREMLKTTKDVETTLKGVIPEYEKLAKELIEQGRFTDEAAGEMSFFIGKLREMGLTSEANAIHLSLINAHLASMGGKSLPETSKWFKQLGLDAIGLGGAVNPLIELFKKLDDEIPDPKDPEGEGLGAQFSKMFSSDSIGKAFKEAFSGGDALGAAIQFGTDLAGAVAGAFSDKAGVIVDIVGSMLSKLASGDIPGLITQGIGLIAQGLAKLAGGTPLWEAFGGQAKNAFGQGISEGLSQAMEEFAESVDSKDFPTIAGLFLPEMIGEMDSSLANLQTFNTFFQNALMGIQSGAIGGKDALDKLNASFNALVAEAEKMGATSSVAFLRIVHGAKLSGIEIAGLSEFIQERLQGAVEGLNTFTEIAFKQLGEGMTDTFRFIPDSAEDIQDFGFIANDIFRALQESGMSLVDALRQMSPALEELFKKSREFGAELSEPIADLLKMGKIVGQNEDLFNQLDALNQIAKGLGETISFSQEGFTALQNQAISIFERLTQAGFTEQQALFAMADTLQVILGQQEAFGLVVDENTQALLDQALAMGIIKTSGDPVVDAMTKGFGKIVDVLKLIAVALGAELPKHMETLGAAAKKTGEIIHHSFFISAKTIDASFKVMTKEVISGFLRVQQSAYVTARFIGVVMAKSAGYTQRLWCDEGFSGTFEEECMPRVAGAAEDAAGTTEAVFIESAEMVSQAWDIAKDEIIATFDVIAESVGILTSEIEGLINALISLSEIPAPAFGVGETGGMGVGGGGHTFGAGGYTGSSGGTVGPNEYVFDPVSVARIGLDNLARMHREARTGAAEGAAAASIGTGGGPGSTTVNVIMDGEVIKSVTRQTTQEEIENGGILVPIDSVVGEF